MLYPVTSHYRLIMFIGEKFGEKYNKPLMKIQLISEDHVRLKDKFKYDFSTRIRREDNELFRESVETVFCSFEKSLDVFDEMFEKLKAATETNLAILNK